MEPLPQQITTLGRADHTTPPAPVRHPAMQPEEIPPGIAPVTLADGTRTLAYVQPPTTTAPTSPTVKPIPRWARTTALLAPTIGTGLGAAGIGLSYAAPGILAMAQALWATVALVAAGGLTAAALLRRVRRPAPITQHITAHGLFSRAGGTINH